MTGSDDSPGDEEIYKKHYVRVWGYFRANGVSDDEAQDLAQDTFKRLYDRMPRLSESDPSPILLSIARTVLLNRMRSQRAARRSGISVTIDDPDFNEPLTSEFDESMLWLDVDRRLCGTKAIRALPIRVFAESNEPDVISAVQSLLEAGWFQ